MLPSAADMLINQETQEPFSSETAGEVWCSCNRENLYGFDIGYSIKVTVYDPADVTVGKINVVGTMGFAVGEGSFDDWQLIVTYSTPNGASFSKTVPFSEDMITEGEVRFDEPGVYLITVTYSEEGKGSTSYFGAVTVLADLSAEEVTATYYFTENTAMLLGVDSVTLYANGVLTLGDYQYAYTLRDGLPSYTSGTRRTFTPREVEASRHRKFSPLWRQRVRRRGKDIISGWVLMMGWSGLRTARQAARSKSADRPKGSAFRTETAARRQNAAAPCFSMRPQGAETAGGSCACGIRQKRVNVLQCG